MTTIITELDKFGYNSIPMRMSKIYNIIGDIKSVEMYIHDILVLSKDYFSINIEHLRSIFISLRKVGIEINDKKCIFWFIDIN